VTRAQAWREGALYTASISPSYIMFGTVCGLASKQAGLDIVQAFALPALVFGGSAQIVITALIIAGAPLLVVIASGIMVNSRMAVYSAIISTWMRQAPQRQRTAVASLIVDQTYAGIEGFRARSPDSPHWVDFYLSSGITLWAWWLLCNVVGYVAGAIVPAHWQLDFVVPLSFVAVLAPIVKRLHMGLAAGLGAMLGVLFYALPFKLGLIAACVLGVSVMALLDAKFKWTKSNSGSSS
jgi:predicted branched-subunit amino acid permease